MVTPLVAAASSVLLALGSVTAPSVLIGPTGKGQDAPWTVGAVGSGSGVTRRLDLIGRQYDGAAADAHRIVSVIIEFTGDTVGERRTRMPLVAETSVAQDLQMEQRRFDPLLARDRVQVTGRLVNVLNAVTARVEVGEIPALESLPGVAAVEQAGVVHRLNNLADQATGVPGAWQGLGLTGAGVTIGIIDDGIDYTHADFGGSGNPADYDNNIRTVLEPGTFPTAKVVGGYDFVGDDYDASASESFQLTPVPDPDPLACGDHGTHVSGTAAGQGVVKSTGLPYTGPYDATTLSSVAFSVAPGAAPQAKLRAYKIFGCTGSTDDSVIVRAIDRAVADKVDVINLSLGEALGTGSATDLLVKAVNRASSRGTLVVAAAGNSGPSPYLVASPATADSALAVAAMDEGPPTWPGVDVGTSPAIGGIETNEVGVGAGITGPIKVVIPGCDDGDYADVSGKIVVTSLVQGCVAPLFDHLSGVLAVVVEVDDFFRAGTLDVSVPFVLVHASDAATLQAADGTTVTLTAAAAVADPRLHQFADFTSGGPRRDDQTIKPDVTAPGVALVSARRGSGSGAAEFSGTSMATPVTTGIAALVTQRHPTWTPSQIKAVIMSTADPAAVVDYDPLVGGTGLVGADRATSSVAYLSTADGKHSLSFGFNALATAALSKTKTMKITNTSSSSITYTLAAQFDSPSLGATVTVSPATLTLKGKTSKTVVVKLSFPKAKIPDLPDAAASDFGHLVAIDGTIVATPTAPAPGVYPLRMAFVMVPKGLSAVGAPAKVSGAASSGSLHVINTGRHAGTADVFEWLVHDRVGDNLNREIGDIVDVGVKSFPWDPSTLTAPGPDRQVVFAINTAKAAATKASQEYAVVVDVNADLTFDYLVVGGDEGIETGGPPDGKFVTFTVDLSSLLIVDAYASEAPYNNSVVYLRTTAGSLGGTNAASLPWTLFVDSTSRVIGDTRFDDAPDDLWVVYQPFHPVLSGGAIAPTVIPAGGSVDIPFTVDTSLSAQTHKGFLVISPDDAAGAKVGTRVSVTGV
jgi:subtilisin family serine protease